MKNTLKGKCRFLLPALMLVGAMFLGGCTQVEGDHYENAIRQEQKYQEQISGAKSNDREVEQDLAHGTAGKQKPAVSKKKISG